MYIKCPKCYITILTGPSPDQRWVQLHRNTKKLRRYKEDLALVVGVTGSNLLDLWLVPHLNFGLGQDDMIPAAQLFNANGLRVSFVKVQKSDQTRD